MKGTYLLLLHLHDEHTIRIGKKGEIHFPKGYYVYIGSALNSLEQRIARHLRGEKKIHWHIDYFLPFCTIQHVFYKETTKKEECGIAQEFGKHCASVPGFGCSDCTCLSHLFSGSSADIHTIAHSLGMKPLLLDTNP